MKIKAKKIETLNEFLDSITPPGGEIKSSTAFNAFDSEDETIKLEFMRAKPRAVGTQEHDDKKETEKQNVCLDPMAVLGNALLDRLTKVIPPDAKEMTSETTLTIDRVSINFQFRMLRDKPKEKTENTHKRTHDVSANDERKGKKRKLEK